MNRASILVAMTALALVSACNRGSGNKSASANTTASTNTTTTANSAAPAPAPAPAAGGGEPIDAAFLTANSWAPAGHCNEALTFNADGTATVERDRGNWTLNGTTVTMTNAEHPNQAITIHRQGNNLLMGQGDHSVVASPCPAGAAAGADEKGDTDEK